MFCQNCGARVGDGAKFCESCGSPLAGAPVQQPTAAFDVGTGANAQGATQPYAAAPAAQTPAEGQTQPMGAPQPPYGQTTQQAMPYQPGSTAQMPSANYAGANVPPADTPPQPQPQKSGGLPKAAIIGIIAAVVVVLVVVIGAFGCNSNKGPTTSSSSSSSATIDKSGFVGTWELESGTVEGLESENLDMLRELGLSVTLTLKENGTGTFDLLGSESDVTWEATSNSGGTLILDGANMTVTLKGGKLTLENETHDTMTFAPAGTIPVSSTSSSKSSSSSSSSSSTASSSSSSSTKSSSSSSSSTSSSSSSTSTPAGMQTIGNPACGYLQVPSNWVDRTSDYNPNIVDSTEMVYYVDPDSEYTSAALMHFMFSRSVQLRCYPTSYNDILQQVLAGYEDDIYGDVDYDQASMNGRNCYVITTEIVEDGLYLCNLVVDRDGDNKATVLFTLAGTPSTIESVLGYAATWSPTK